MAGFWFTVSDVSPADDGWGAGVFLVGPPGDTSSGLSAGDRVAVPLTTGEHVAKCLGFPLLNLGPERLRWVTLHIELPEGVQVLVGERVTKVEA